MRKKYSLIGISCPLKSISELKEIYFNYPKQWEIIKTMDNYAYNRFRADYSINDLEAKFNNMRAVNEKNEARGYGDDK